MVGSTIRINRMQYAVLGVAPAGFYGTEIFYRPNIWVPMSMQAQIEVGTPWLENRNTSIRGSSAVSKQACLSGRQRAI